MPIVKFEHSGPQKPGGGLGEGVLTPPPQNFGKADPLLIENDTEKKRIG